MEEKSYAKFLKISMEWNFDSQKGQEGRIEGGGESGADKP